MHRLVQINLAFFGVLKQRGACVGFSDRPARVPVVLFCLGVLVCRGGVFFQKGYDRAEINEHCPPQTNQPCGIGGGGGGGGGGDAHGLGADNRAALIIISAGCNRDDGWISFFIFLVANRDCKREAGVGKVRLGDCKSIAVARVQVKAGRQRSGTV